MSEKLDSRYYSIHAWLKLKYGKASFCENVNCKNTPKRFEWALKKGCVYDRNRDNFIQLCPSCHRKYDITDATRNKMSKSAKINGHFVTNNPMKDDSMQKMASNWMSNRKVSKETKEKHSKIMKQRPLNFTPMVRYGRENPASRKVLNTETGEMYDTVKKAAEVVGLKITTLIMMLNGSNRNKTTLVYYEQPRKNSKRTC